MNSTFVPGIGALSVQRVYVSADQPLLFSATNILGDHFLVSYADMTETGDLWMLIRLSNGRLSAFESQQIDIRSAFTNNETGTILFVEYFDDDSVPSISHASSNDPKLEQYLALPNIFAPRQPISLNPSIRYIQNMEISSLDKSYSLNLIVNSISCAGEHPKNIISPPLEFNSNAYAISSVRSLSA